MTGFALPFRSTALKQRAMKREIPSSRGVLEAELLRQRDPARAAIVAGFFKCGPGEYGEGDQFLGLTVPVLRRLARGYRHLGLDEIQHLLDSPWHEVRFVGIVLLATRYPRVASDAERAALYRLYLANLKRGRIANWDLVDVSCEHVIGAYLETRDRAPLYRMAKSSHLWTRRVAIIATFRFIKRGEWKDTLAIAELLLEDEHDLIHKATGWMLREVGKRASEAALIGFLEKHAATMPRTMLRYAIERLDERRRRDFMARRKRAVSSGR